MVKNELSHWNLLKNPERAQTPLWEQLYSELDVRIHTTLMFVE